MAEAQEEGRAQCSEMHTESRPILQGPGRSKEGFGLGVGKVGIHLTGSFGFLNKCKLKPWAVRWKDAREGKGDGRRR